MRSETSARYVRNCWLGSPIAPFDDPWFRFTRLLEVLDAIRRPTQGETWLDLGCHQGQFVCVLREKYGIIGTGMDDWPASLKDDDTWRYFQCDLAKGIRLDEKFVFISALEVIEHMIDTDAFLIDCNKHLRDAGFLLLTTPNINSLRNRMIIPLGKYPVGLEHKTVIHHVRLYNPSVLRAHLEEHGFSIQCIRGVNFLPIKLVRRQSKILDMVDAWLAANCPQLCNNIIVLAKKVRSL